MRRLVGLRLFFVPAARARLGLVFATAGGLLYLARAVVQLSALRREIATADFPVFYNAARDLGAGHDPYAGFLANCPGWHWCLGGYIYPPLLAELLRPLTALDPVAAFAAWTLLSHVLLLTAAAVAWRTVAADLPPAAGRWLVAACLFFLPIYQNLYAGSVGAPLLLVLALAAWACARGQAGRAGALLALGAVLRVTPAAIGPVLLRTRHDLRRPVGAAVAVAVGVGLMGGLAMLTPFTLEYLRAVLPRISGATGFVSNVSLPGVALRLQQTLLGGDLPGAGLVGTGLAVVVIGWTWWAGFGIPGRGARVVAFAALLAATSLASSVTWNYHLVNELLVIALMAPWASRGRHATRLVLWSYPLLWVYADGVLAAGGVVPAGAPGRALFLAVTSLNALGMLLLWLACLDVLRGLRQGAGTE